jgi:hypothetical protein
MEIYLHSPIRLLGLVLSFKKARSDVNFGDLEADMLNLGI